MDFRTYRFAFVLAALSAAAHAQTAPTPPKDPPPEDPPDATQSTEGALTGADMTSDSEYMRRLQIHQRLSPLDGTPFGEQINPYTGELSFRHTDLVFEGTGPDIRLARQLDSHQFGDISLELSSFGNWSLSIPRIETLASAPNTVGPITNPGDYWYVGDGDLARCTHFNRPRYSVNVFNGQGIGWNGIALVTEDGGTHAVLKRSTQNTAQPSMTGANGQPVAFPAVTQDGWQIGCLPSTSNGQAGEAFLVVSPDGTRYWMDYLVGVRAPSIDGQIAGGGPGAGKVQQRMIARMYVSRIVDRFGNAVDYHYTDAQLTSITASDGRSVAIAWRSDFPVIASITQQPGTSPARTWQYAYTADGSALTGVTLPDGGRWTFALSGLTQDTSPVTQPCGSRTVGGVGTQTWVSTVTAPSGLSGTFTVAPVGHARSYVPTSCLTGDPDYPTGDYENIPTAYTSRSLVRRDVSGPGLATATTLYAYSTGTSSSSADACALAGTCAETSWVDTTDPVGNRTRHTYSNRWGPLEGKEVRTDYYQGTSTLLRTDTFQYAAASGGPWPASLGSTMTSGLSTHAQETLTPLSSRVVAQQGISFSHSVAGFDAFARETSATDSSTLGDSRSVQTTWHDNIAGWVLGQVATRTIAGVQAERTDYDAADRPWKTYAFGKLTSIRGYWPTGDLNTATDGAGNTTWYGDYYRGIPRLIGYPATPEVPAGATASATVNAYGWITQVTDENGYATGYAYDAMGRVSGITYPAGDSVAWNGTSIAFAQVASAEYGIAAGHWRQTVSTGNARKVTYFDALWRPVLVREYDTGNVAGTDRYSATAYDKLGRVWRAAYPVAAAPAMSAADWTLPGTRTSYDALGRPTSVVQDAEAPYGTLTTTTSYGTGFKTTVTNARGKVTTSTFQAWDQPVTEFPKAIALPEGAYVDIARDAFGKPTSITRRNSGSTVAAIRTYAYNANQELCRVVEPEIGPAADSKGATLMGYDGAGNLAWSASGLAPTTACDAEGDTAAILARKASCSYDARNRISTLTFPDGNGNQSWTYTPDGLPASVNTYNDAGASSVVNTYAYNKRRLPVGETLQADANTWTVGYAYTGNGALSTLTYPDSLSVAYAPNALGQPTQAGTFATAVSYWPNGAIKQFTYGNGIVHTLAQNARGLPDRSRDADGAISIHDDGYDYDQVGNVLAISDAVSGNRGNRDMAYDGLDRLTSATSPMFGTATYAYDVLDNLTRVTVAGGSQPRNHDYCYDAHNRLTNIKTGGCSAGATVIGLGYDVQGNLANKSGVIYTFDYGNRLRAGGPETYRYDVQGRRVRSNSSAGLIYSLYAQSGQLLFQRDERSSKRRQYVYLGGSLVAESAVPLAGGAATVTYQHTDALGSPVATTSSTKAVLQRSEHEPYGYLLNRPMEDGPGYTGHVTDAATGLVYMQQRYYDPVIGAFLSTDPVTANSPGGTFNRYWYANDNPYRFYDPDGRQACSTACLNMRERSDRVGGAMSGWTGTARDAFFGRLNDRAGSVVHSSEASAVGYFGSLALPLQKKLGVEIGANLAKYTEADFRVVDFHPGRTRSEVGVQIFGDGHPGAAWAGIMHTHPGNTTFSGEWTNANRYLFNAASDANLSLAHRVNNFLVRPDGNAQKLNYDAWMDAASKDSTQSVYAHDYIETY